MSIRRASPSTKTPSLPFLSVTAHTASYHPTPCINRRTSALVPDAWAQPIP